MSKCFVCRVIPTSKGRSKYRVLNEEYTEGKDILEGPFSSFKPAFERVKIYRGLELLGIERI